MEVTVECQKRAEGSKPNALRRAGLIPAVLYGHNGTESVALSMGAKEAELLLKKATINNTLIQVNIPDIPWSGQALLREVQSHPWKKKELYHLSFFSVAAHGAIDLTVPVHFVGEPAGIKAGGVLDPVITELNIHCSPDKIPDSIELDVSNLEVGDSIQVEQIVVPEGVAVLNEPGATVVTIAAPRTGTAAEAAEGTEA